MIKPFSLGATTLYEEYQKYNKLHQDYLRELKVAVTAILIKKRLFSCMNTTKWLELQDAVTELSFPPAYIAKYVTDKENDPHVMIGIDSLEREVPWWIGNWSNYYDEGMAPLFNIGWIAVRPQLRRTKGTSLIKPEIIKETNNFRAILAKLHIPYEETGTIFTVYGYKAP